MEIARVDNVIINTSFEHHQENSIGISIDLHNVVCNDQGEHLKIKLNKSVNKSEIVFSMDFAPRTKQREFYSQNS